MSTNDLVEGRAVIGGNGQSLSRLSDGERQQLLSDWNNTAVSYPGKNLCLHQLFEEQARRTPDQVALVFEGQRLTYGELDRRANQLALQLRNLGAGPDVLVGLFVQRSLEMVLGMLGILKAGAAYVPIDPAYPQDRIGYILGDAKATLRVTQTSLVKRLPKGGAEPVCLDSACWSDLPDAPQAPAPCHPANLAYVIYTSGSTGRPKGVGIEHRNIVNYVLGVSERLKLQPGMNHATVSTIAADLGNTVIFPALTTGGCLHVISQERAESQSLLSEYFQRERIDVLKIVPSHLAALQSGKYPERAMPRSRLILGGEASRLDWIERLRTLSPGCEIYNHYGPTETTVGVLTYRIEARLPGTPSGTLPIGRPLPNSCAYILDASGQPVPVGTQGELYIGGSGVARGYINRPELTAQKFVPDPFAPAPDGRLYRTGDLARYLPDGNIEFCGRIDDQVKIHGYRVELGEIETALREHGGVRDVVVLASEVEPGNKQLVAYVVPKRANQTQSDRGSEYALTDGSPAGRLNKNQADSLYSELFVLQAYAQHTEDATVSLLGPEDEEILTPKILRDHLKDRLPHYMVPSVFVLREKIPLTPNGKIDREAVAAVSREELRPVRECVGPSTEMERALVSIWTEVLKVENIGTDDDFFELGGDSLQAIRVVSRVRDVFEVELPIHVLLYAPTIAELAEILRNSQWTPSWSSLVPLRAAGSRPSLFLFHAHGGNVLEYHALASHLEADQPVYALQARGLDGNIAPDQTVEKMASNYIEEMRSLQPEGPYFLAGFCFGGLLALEAAQQLTDAGQQVALVLLIQTRHPAVFYLDPSIPLWRRRWYQISRRIDLERENLSHAGKGYILERFRRAWEMIHARVAIARDQKTGKRPADPSALPRLYLFEVLRMEHSKALAKYVPRPYDGDVVLFRASKQLRGLEGGEYLGWKTIFRGCVELCQVPGHQQNLMLEPNVQQLASALTIQLNAAQQRYGGADEERSCVSDGRTSAEQSVSNA